MMYMKFMKFMTFVTLFGALPPLTLDPPAAAPPSTPPVAAPVAAPVTVPPPVGAPLQYAAQYLTKRITIDGKLNDEAWKEIRWTEDFIDIEGSSKPAPRYRTRVKMAWDERCFYIAAELEEPDVWATYRTHDEIVFHEPDFEIFIDPDGDTRAYYEIEVNCLGTIFDLYLHRTYRDGGPAVHGWNCAGLHTGIDVIGSMNDPRDDDQRWTLEWAIPWSGLQPPVDAAFAPDTNETARAGAAPKPGDTWRVNFSRVQWKHNFEELDASGRRIGPKRPPGPLPINDNIRQAAPPSYEKVKGAPEDNWVWSSQGAIDMHLPDRWGRVSFIKERASPALRPDPAHPHAP
ncbi:MAG: carbohydrate-binding family 9-like protein [Phycisphaerae bacterium]|mgnify:CR=1 FL=1|nr:carbohydrate-binding family 9-like protein [Phycisphaerae bacterium]